MVKRGPSYSLKVSKESVDGWELGFYRDQLGNVEIKQWKFGEGARPVLAKPNLNDLKKLRNWLSKLIEYVERP